jgi:hypothetical protein
MKSHWRFLVLASLPAVLAGSATTAAGPSVPPNVWTPLKATGDAMSGGLPGRRGWIQVAVDAVNGEVVMFGGDAETYLSDLLTYSFAENHWRQRRTHPDLEGPCRRDNHNFVYDSVDRKFWMWNGSIGSNQAPERSARMREDAERRLVYVRSAQQLMEPGRRSPQSHACGGGRVRPEHSAHPSVRWRTKSFLQHDGLDTALGHQDGPIRAFVQSAPLASAQREHSGRTPLRADAQKISVVRSPPRFGLHDRPEPDLAVRRTGTAVGKAASVGEPACERPPLHGVRRGQWSRHPPWRAWRRPHKHIR